MKEVIDWLVNFIIIIITIIVIMFTINYSMAVALS